MTQSAYASSGYDTRFKVKFESNILQFNIKLDDGYKIYSNAPGDVGFPTQINLEHSENLKSSNIIWPIAEKEYFHGTMFHYIYSGEVSIPVDVEAVDISHPIIIKGVITYAICSDRCVPVTQNIELNLGKIQDDMHNIIWILVAAFIGGAILNLMPCVLPVLMLKIFSIINNRNDGYRLHLIATICGIFSTFFILGYLTFCLKSIGVSFGMGANFQSPQFVIILCIIMVIFASNLLGRFEIVVPDSISSKLSSYRFKTAYISSFASGVIATIFATPCTAPFLGSAISFAMTADFIQIMQIFTSIALGFSVPYILLLIVPNMLNFLPRPGPWMFQFKRVLALVMVCTILWLLSILNTQLGFRAMLGVLMLLMLIKFIFEQDNIRKSVRLLVGIVLFIGAMYLPNIASEEDQKKINEEIALWEPFDQARLDNYINEGKIVVVDITADWCLTCKYNKFIFWNRAKTMKLLSEANVIAMRGDLTKPSAAIHDYLASRAVYGIPFDIVYGPKAKNGIMLPTIVRYNDLSSALNKATFE